MPISTYMNIYIKKCPHSHTTIHIGIAFPPRCIYFYTYKHLIVINSIICIFVCGRWKTSSWGRTGLWSWSWCGSIRRGWPSCSWPKEPVRHHFVHRRPWIQLLKVYDCFEEEPYEISANVGTLLNIFQCRNLTKHLPMCEPYETSAIVETLWNICQCRNLLKTSAKLGTLLNIFQCRNLMKHLPMCEPSETSANV